MRIKAAILKEFLNPLVVEEIELDDKLRGGDVLVKVVATGLCHTDIHPTKGDMPMPIPIVLGHEGAGIVEKVGAGVTMVKPGDHVVLSVAPYCGKCPRCVAGKPYICDLAQECLFGGVLLDGSTRIKTKDGQDLYHFFAQSSFAEYCVVDERTAIKIRDDAPLDRACLFGCGITTGLGAVLNTAKVEVNSSVAVFGCGGVGLATIIGAKIARANPIIAVDILESKLEAAKELGATHSINPAKKEDPVQRIGMITDRGVDYSFEAVGNVELQAQAADVLAPGGVMVIVGAAPMGARAGFDTMSMIFDRTIKGTAAGNMRPTVDIPRNVDLYMQGLVPLDKLITRTYRIEQINEAMEAVLKGEVLRCVILW